MGGARILRARFRTAREFQEHHRCAPAHRSDLGAPAARSLFCRTRTDLWIGERVLVELDVPGVPGRSVLRGEVTGFDPFGAGAWVAVERADVPTLDFVLAVARQGSADPAAVHRRHVRFPVTLPVAWRIGGGLEHTVSVADDVSAGGLCVKTLSPVAVGTNVLVRLRRLEAALQATLGRRELELGTRVAWTRHSGPFTGMGLRFADPTNDSTRWLRETLRRVSERGRISLTS